MKYIVLSFDDARMVIVSIIEEGLMADADFLNMVLNVLKIKMQFLIKM